MPLKPARSWTVSMTIVLQRTAQLRNGWLHSKTHNVIFEDAPRAGRLPTTITDQNIEAVDQVVIHDRQISIRRMADELNIPKSSVHRIMNEHLDMKKGCTKWVRMYRVDCCE